MSYCVNCGVQLELSEKACPLCGVDVVNPLQPYSDKAERPYPRRLDAVNERINRRFTGEILSICMAFPAILCVAINLILNGQANWGLIVAGALALLWVMVVPFFLYRQPTFVVLFLPITAAVLLYLLLLASLTPDGSWYMLMAMPITLLTCGLIFINGVWITAGILRGFAIPAAVLISVGLLTMGIEVIVEDYLFGNFSLGWSLYVMIPSLAVAMVFLTIVRRQSIREEIKKRLHH